MDPLKTQLENKMRWRTLAFLAIVLVFSMSTWFSATAVIPQPRSVWMLNPSTAAWLKIAFQLGIVVGAVISSLFNLADLLSSRFIIMIGAIGAGIANFLLLFAGGPVVGIILRFATGFFIAAVYPPVFKLISTWFQENHGLALGILAAAGVVGNGIPHLINALGGLDWRIVIAITSLQSL
jgi:MFS family permease